jgi:hypothetical protein
MPPKPSPEGKEEIMKLSRAEMEEEVLDCTPIPHWEVGKSDRELRQMEAADEDAAAEAAEEFAQDMAWEHELKSSPMVQCTECPRTFPLALETYCMIGARLCPHCQVKQMRYPYSSLAEESFWVAENCHTLDDWNPEDCDPWNENCTCKRCTYDRQKYTFRQGEAEKERRRMDRISAYVEANP